MDPESEIRQIQQTLAELSLKVDELVHEQEITTLMKISDTSLCPFLDKEPDLYSLSDAKVVLLK